MLQIKHTYKFGSFISNGLVTSLDCEIILSITQDADRRASAS